MRVAFKETHQSGTAPKVPTEEVPFPGIEPFHSKFALTTVTPGSTRHKGGNHAGLRVDVPVQDKRKKDWIGFTEVYGMPLRVGKYEPGATRADRKALIQAVRSLGSDAAGIIFKSTEIEFI